jgi:hypothetical protein
MWLSSNGFGESTAFLVTNLTWIFNDKRTLDKDSIHGACDKLIFDLRILAARQSTSK